MSALGRTAPTSSVKYPPRYLMRARADVPTSGPQRPSMSYSPSSSSKEGDDKEEDGSDDEKKNISSSSSSSSSDGTASTSYDSDELIAAMALLNFSLPGAV